MSKNAGLGSIRKKTVKSNGKEYTYWAVLISSRDAESGELKRHEKTFSTYEAAADYYRILSSPTERAKLSMPKEKRAKTVSAWFDEWLLLIEADVSPSTLRAYSSKGSTHIKPALGKNKLVNLDRETVKKFINKLSKEGLAPKTVKNVHGVLSKCLQDAVEYGYIPFNPAAGIKLPKQVRKEINPLTDKQQRDFLKAIENDPYCSILKLILFTGLRESEALGLTYDCVDYKSNTIVIKQQLLQIDGVGYSVSSTKSGRSRRIELAPAVMDIIRQEQLKQSEYKKKLRGGWQGMNFIEGQKSAFIFTDELGNHLIQGTMYKHYKKIVTDIGVPTSRVHDLRHTYAVNCLESGDKEKTLQQHLGHATASFTLDVYGHVSDRMKEDSRNRMQERFESLLG